MLNDAALNIKSVDMEQEGGVRRQLRLVRWKLNIRPNILYLKEEQLLFMTPLANQIHLALK